MADNDGVGVLFEASLPFPELKECCQAGGRQLSLEGSESGRCNIVVFSTFGR